VKLNSFKSQYTDLIPSEKKSLKSSIKEIYEIIANPIRNYIFFDLETLGMHPNAETDQIIEIAASVCSSFDTNDTIATFHKKIKISKSSEMIFDKNNVMRDVWIKRNSKFNSDITPEHILSMTKYSNNLDHAISEEVGIQDFLNFISKFENPILVAHNAGYDVKFLSTRANKVNLKLENYDVIDTLKICRYFFIPLLTSRKEYSIEKQIYNKLLYKTPRRSLSSKLGNVADALGINSSCWHTANGDVEMLRYVMCYICDFFKSNIDADIKKYQSININRKANRKKVK